MRLDNRVNSCFSDFAIIYQMTIIEVYQKFKNPPNLQEHMLRVTKVGLFIYNHWTGSSIDKDLLLKVLLLHDIGNIVKFDMVKYPHFLGKEEQRIAYWIGVQKEIIDKYGSDDNEVTGKMLNELGVDQIILKTVLDMSYLNALNIAKSDNWILKILLYSDLRVSPSGVIPLRNRLDDVFSRLEKYKNRKDLYDAALMIENQIQDNIDISVSKITDESITADDNQLLEIEI
jgi:hypothetical protein